MVRKKIINEKVELEQNKDAKSSTLSVMIDDVYLLQIQIINKNQSN